MTYDKMQVPYEKTCREAPLETQCWAADIHAGHSTNDRRCYVWSKPFGTLFDASNQQHTPMIPYDTMWRSVRKRYVGTLVQSRSPLTCNIVASQRAMTVNVYATRMHFDPFPKLWTNNNKKYATMVAHVEQFLIGTRRFCLCFRQRRRLLACYQLVRHDATVSAAFQVLVKPFSSLSNVDQQYTPKASCIPFQSQIFKVYVDKEHSGMQPRHSHAPAAVPLTTGIYFSKSTSGQCDCTIASST